CFPYLTPHPHAGVSVSLLPVVHSISVSIPDRRGVFNKIFGDNIKDGDKRTLHGQDFDLNL
ncbi:MAG: hypothetical protein RIC80_16465, partial [Cyclobacteriaceae bacterium]